VVESNDSIDSSKIPISDEMRMTVPTISVYPSKVFGSIFANAFNRFQKKMLMTEDRNRID